MGYGWQAGSVYSLSWGGDPLTRDLNYTVDATYAYDLPSGQYELTLTLGHVNHRIRGRQSDEDSRWVVEFARFLGVPCMVGSADIPGRRMSRGGSLEDVARNARRALLEDMRATFRADAVRNPIGIGIYKRGVQLEIQRVVSKAPVTPPLPCLVTKEP